MAFGRCEVVRLSRNIELKDYELRSYNFPISNYTGSGFILDLPDGINFMLTTISIFTNAKLFNKPSEGRIDALMWALLRAYAVDIKVQDEKGDIYFPLNNIPLDLFVSPKSDNSVTSPEVFNVVDFLGTPIWLSCKNTNIIVVRELFEDTYKEIVVPMLPLVPDDVRKQMYLQARQALMNRLQLCLNGFYIKNPDFLLVREDIIDVSVNTRRFTFSKNLTPTFIHISTYDTLAEVRRNDQQKFVFNEETKFSCNNGICKLQSDVVETPSPLITGYTSQEGWILEIVLPRVTKDYMIKDLEIVFTQLPPHLVVGGRYWAIPALGFRDLEGVYKYEGVGVLSGCSYIIKDFDFFVPESAKKLSSLMEDEGNSQIEEGGYLYPLYPYLPFVYSRPQPSKFLGGEVEIVSDDRKDKFFLPNLLQIVGDDAYVAKTAIDVFMDMQEGFFDGYGGYFDKYKTSSLSSQDCQSVYYPKDKYIYIREKTLPDDLKNFLDGQNYGQLNVYREDFYLPKYKTNLNIFPELGFSYSSLDNNSDGFVYVIPARTMVRFRIKIPQENNIASGILFMNAFLIEE